MTETITFEDRIAEQLRAYAAPAARVAGVAGGSARPTPGAGSAAPP